MGAHIRTNKKVDNGRTKKHVCILNFSKSAILRTLIPFFMSRFSHHIIVKTFLKYQF